MRAHKAPKKTRSINTRAPIKPRIRAKKCYSHPTNRSRVHVALRKTLNIRAARENFSSTSPRLFSHQKCVHKRERKTRRKKFPTQNDQRPPERDVIQSTALTSTSSKDHLPKSFTSCVASSAIFVVCCYAFTMNVFARNFVRKTGRV